MNIPITIITPVKDDQKIKNLADSIFRQSDMVRFEWILSLNGSKKEFIRQVKELVRGRLNCHVLVGDEANIAKALNSAIDKAASNFLWFVDSDCVLEPGSLKIVRESIKDAGKVYTGKVTFIGESKFAQLTAKLRNYVYLPQERSFYMPNLIINKSLFNDFGLFNTNLQYGFDSEFCARVVNKGVISENIANLVVYHYCHTQPADEIKIWYQYGKGRAFRYEKGYLGTKSVSSLIKCFVTPRLIYSTDSLVYVLFALLYYSVRGYGILVGLLTKNFS